MAKIKKILIPTDFSENADSVFDFAEETAANYKAKVDLLHVVPRLSYLKVNRDALGNPFDDKDKYSEFRKGLEKKMQARLAERLPKAHRGKVYIINQERPVNGIINHADKEKYDLIMIASRGWGNSVFTRGSVTEKLIRTAQTPVLSVNKGYDHDINTVLVPTDGSRTSLEALPMALLIAAQNKASIKLLRVSIFDSARPKIAGMSSYRFTDEELKENLMNTLTSFVGENENRLVFAKSPNTEDKFLEIKNDVGEVVKVEMEVDKGESAYAAIVDYAEECAQVVVIATHGRSAMAHLFIGSTTEKVVRHLKMPVLTIKPKSMKSKQKQRK